MIDKLTLLNSFYKVRCDIENQQKRICDLVSVLLKILPKKTLDKELPWGYGIKTVKDILLWEIDP